MPKLITVGQLIDHSWDHYRERFTELISVAAWLLIPAIVSTISLSLYPSATTLASTQPLSGIETLAIILGVVNLLIITPVVGIWVFIALIRLIEAQRTKKKIDIADITSKAWKSFWPMLLVIVLIFLIMIGAALMVAPGILLNFIAIRMANDSLSALAGLLIIVGSMASVYFGVRWLVYYALAQYALMIDGKHGRSALTQSRKMMEGRFWPVVARLVLPKIVFVLIAFVVSYLLTSLSNIILDAVAGLNIDTYLRLSSIFTIVIGFIVAVLINPIVMIADFLLYESLKTTKR